MIDRGDFLLHLEPRGDRISHAKFEFTGWIASDHPVKAVWLPTIGPARLTICDRPDVRRAFPNRLAIGFGGKCAAQAIGPDGLRIALQFDDQTIEMDHPVPEPLPMPPLGRRVLAGLLGTWLRWRERMASNPSDRFGLILRRHLLARQLRSGLFDRHHTEALLSDFARAVPDAVFLQIGANDGFTGDPLYPLIANSETRWQGVLVEPVAHLFAELSRLHASRPNLRLERAAITERDGTTVIHRLTSTPADSLWLDQIPSLDRDLLKKGATQFEQSARAIIEEEVPSLTVATLLQRHAISRLDLLVIDAEGWDWRILRQFDLKRVQPKLVLYEHQHLSASERAEAHQFLSEVGYGWAETKEGDTLAWREP
ncbi:MAG TPA: FkbM family methyltransferase [Chthoniobacterales bacterium]|jgi:FkbM family methyltransferase|nr:FkbM family methyltransferase [Chthoniobacterales bacterium]